MFLDWSQAYQPGYRWEQSRSRNRPPRILPQRRVGHPRSASREAREILPLLRRTLPRYFLQHYLKTKNIVLYRQLNSTLCRNLIFIGPSLLSSGGLWREDSIVHQHLTLPNHVFPPHFRNHTVYISRTASIREIYPLHHGTRRIVSRYNNHHFKCPL